MNLDLILFIGTFLVLLLIGSPIYFSLLASSLVYFIFNPGIGEMMICQKIFGGLDSFVLLAVPMFMMSGNLMNSGGVTDRIFGFANKLCGHVRGGLGHVNIVSSFIFSGMSGSALADVGGLGQIEMAAMKAENYDDDMTLGITAASATMGPIVPPSIPMVIYGAVANVSVGALFLGGLMPGIVMAIVLGATVVVISQKRKYPVHKKATLREIWDAAKRAFLSLMMPVIVMGGIWSGFFTPTEAAMVSIIYVLIILFLVYREIGLKDLMRVMFETVESVAPSLGIIAGSALFGWVLQFERLDQVLIKAIFAVTSNRYIILLMLNAILLFFGMILDATPIIMLFVPLLLPLAKAIGVHEVHMGVIVVLNLMIGLMTPPIGQSLFVMSAVTGHSFEYVVQKTWRWLIPLFIALLVVTFVPDTVMWLPRMFGLVS